MDWNLAIIIVLIIYFFINLYLKISSKITVVISLILLIGSAILLIMDKKDLANNLAIIVFYMFIVSIVLVIAENYREFKKGNENRGEKQK